MAAAGDRIVCETTTLSLDIGGQIILKAPVNNNETGSGAFPETGTVAFGGQNYALTLGFGIANTSIGVLEPTENEDCLEVKYTHNQPANQTICFFAVDGRVSKIDIVRVPVHDHSSIYQGGPAHGTYYSEAELQPQEGD